MVRDLEVFWLAIRLANDTDCVLSICYPSSWSNAHYGKPAYLMNPGRGKNMADGWETARRADRPAILEVAPDGKVLFPGFEWAVLKLGVRGTVDNIEVDTIHFKGNFPESVFIEYLDSPDPSSEAMAAYDSPALTWKPLLKRVKLSANKQHYFRSGGDDMAKDVGPITHIRVNLYPDGGISRVRLNGFRV